MAVRETGWSEDVATLGGIFDAIDDVTPKAERDEFMAHYKQAAGARIGAR